MIQEKSKLIDNLKLEIGKDSLQFDELIHRHNGEMDRTVCCAREQMNKLRQCYTEELTKIETATVDEWQQLFQKHQQELSAAFQDMKAHSVDRFDKTRLICDKWECELDELRIKKVDEYRAIEAELELDVERLEQCLQNLKSALLLNEEKLDYGCQVLRNREEEHCKVKANQKRKLAKLNDVMVALKASLAKVENENREHLCHVDRDCKRIRQQILNREKGFRQIEITDNAKLEELWRLNDETAKNLVDELLEIDRQICVNILQIPWQPPSLSFFTNPATYKSLAIPVGSRAATSTAKRIHCVTLFRMGILATRGRLLKSKQSLEDVETENHNRRPPPFEVRREILRSLSSEATFLIDKPLQDMITTIPSDEQVLVQLDAIFEALDIKDDSEVDSLVKYVYESCCKTEEVSEGNGSDCGPSLKLPSVTFDIEAGAVLKAVSDFLEKKQKRCSLLETLERVNNLREGTTKRTRLDWKCTDYWNQFANILPDFNEDLWEALLNKLQKLRQIKLERSKLLDEIRQLQIQNGELQFLLSEYVKDRNDNGLKNGQIHE